MSRNKYGGNKAKGMQKAKHAKSGKYRRQFIRTVLRTGRWRGKAKTMVDLK